MKPRKSNTPRRPQKEISLIMKALCGLLFLFAFGVLVLTAFAQEPQLHEGRALYDCTDPATITPKPKPAPSLPSGLWGHDRRFTLRRYLQHKKLKVKRRAR